MTWEDTVMNPKAKLKEWLGDKKKKREETIIKAPDHCVSSVLRRVWLKPTGMGRRRDD